MRIINTLCGRGVPVPGHDIDTDRIIPARFLRCVTFDGLGEHAFADDRRQLQAAGQLHPFDNPDYAGARVLVVGSNFGCGSSREHAPQSLQKWGIEAIVGESFAEIFFNNNIAIGVPCLRLAAENVDRLQRLIQENPQLEIHIDLETCCVSGEGFSFPATMPESARQMFIRGQWDVTGQLMSHIEKVRVRARQIPYLNNFAI